MPQTARLIRDYLEAVNAGPEGLERARALLADDLEYDDPMMTARDADDLIRQIERLGGGEATIEIREVVAEGDTAAALTLFHPPEGPAIPFAQWFRVDGGRIASIRVIYDPRPFSPPAPRE